jgi:hypothetical protein
MKRVLFDRSTFAMCAVAATVLAVSACSGSSPQPTASGPPSRVAKQLAHPGSGTATVTVNSQHFRLDIGGCAMTAGALRVTGHDTAGRTVIFSFNPSAHAGSLLFIESGRGLRSYDATATPDKSTSRLTFSAAQHTFRGTATFTLHHTAPNGTKAADTGSTARGSYRLECTTMAP